MSRSMLKTILAIDEDGNHHVVPVDIGAKVHIDGCDSVTATVVGVIVRAGDIEAQVSWWNNGALQTEWVALWRLSPAKPQWRLPDKGDRS